MIICSYGNAWVLKYCIWYTHDSTFSILVLCSPLQLSETVPPRQGGCLIEYSYTLNSHQMPAHRSDMHGAQLVLAAHNMHVFRICA